MRVLLDNNVNHRYARLLAGHEVRHARQMGWAELLNGDLIAAGEAADFDVLITADKQMRHQQNVTGRKMAVIVLNALLITLPYISPLAPQVQKLLDDGFDPGVFILVSPEQDP